MSRNKTIFILSAVIFIMPALGFPRGWRDFFSSASALAIAGIILFEYRKSVGFGYHHKSDKPEKKESGDFSGEAFADRGPEHFRARFEKQNLEVENSPAIENETAKTN